MDTGLISFRYAKALLKCSIEAKNEDGVQKDMSNLAKNMITTPNLRKAIDSPMLSKNNKQKLLLTACGNNVSPTTDSFIRLVVKNDREKILQFIANSYITLYRKHKNIISGKLITATPVSNEVEEKMKQLITSKTNGTVEFQTEINKDLLGGFILEYDTYRMDASVKSKLNLILAQLKK